jgi:hypothetical protein
VLTTPHKMRTSEGGGGQGSISRLGSHRRRGSPQPADGHLHTVQQAIAQLERQRQELEQAEVLNSLRERTAHEPHYAQPTVAALASWSATSSAAVSVCGIWGILHFCDFSIMCSMLCMVVHS